MKACAQCRGRGYYDRWSISIDGEFIEPDEHGPKGEPGRDVAPDDSPYWVHGAEVQTLLGDRVGRQTRYVERAPCLGCEARRREYGDRRDAKVERRRERAQKLRGQANADVELSRSLLPDFGQPILVGHHSENRHRRMLERSDNLMRRAIQESKEADRLERLADSTESNPAISSDDPDAIAKLREKLAAMEGERERVKAANRAARKAGKPTSEAWVLSNLGANIRRVKQRIYELERRAAVDSPEDFEIGDVTVSWDEADNRVKLFSPDPGPNGRKARAATMKSHGFRWARSNGCWQRHASQQAWLTAKGVAEQIAKGEA